MSRINSQSLVWETASTPTLNSGWSAAAFNPQLPIVRRNLSSKQAVVSCNLQKNNTTLDSPFTLPSGYRPAVAINGSFWCQQSVVRLGFVLIPTSGAIELYLADGNTLTVAPTQLAFTVHYWLP